MFLYHSYRWAVVDFFYHLLLFNDTMNTLKQVAQTRTKFDLTHPGFLKERERDFSLDRNRTPSAEHLFCRVPNRGGEGGVEADPYIHSAITTQPFRHLFTRENIYVFLS